MLTFNRVYLSGVRESHESCIIFVGVSVGRLVGGRHQPEDKFYREEQDTASRARRR